MMTMWDRSAGDTWFISLLTKVAGRREEAVADGSPEVMTRRVARRAFQISTAAAAIPGPAGFAAILPEVAALTKLQVELIYRIAAYYGKHEKVNTTLILLIFGNALGISLGHGVIRRVEERLIVRTLDMALAKKVARKIGTRMVSNAVHKGLRLAVPFVAAPLFGYFSRALTVRIGKETERLFSGDLEVEPALPPVQAP